MLVARSKAPSSISTPTCFLVFSSINRCKFITTIVRADSTYKELATPRPIDGHDSLEADNGDVGL